jgi:hypothetical protein
MSAAMYLFNPTPLHKERKMRRVAKTAAKVAC